MELKTMEREERSLLLFFETCAVDTCGKVNSIHMNAEDFEIAKKWNETKFVGFGRILAKDVTRSSNHWVVLSPEAWNLAHQERQARAKRTGQYEENLIKT